MRSDVYRNTRELIRSLVPERLLRARREQRFFAANGRFQNLHLGKFASFEECREFARRREVATEYVLDHEAWATRQSTIRAHDYPILYWLGRLLEKDCIVVDLGGSIGVCYYTFQHWLNFPENLSWIVCELPEVVALGERIAEERHAHGLTFTIDRDVMDGSSIVFTAGCLQFIEQPLSDMLVRLKVPPRHVLINRLSLCHDTPTFVTLHHTGYSINPVRIDNFSEFVDSMGKAEYELIDCWKNFESTLHVPEHDECTLQHFYGLYFHKK